MGCGVRECVCVRTASVLAAWTDPPSASSRATLPSLPSIAATDGRTSGRQVRIRELTAVCLPQHCRSQHLREAGSYGRARAGACTGAARSCGPCPLSQTSTGCWLGPTTAASQSRWNPLVPLVSLVRPRLPRVILELNLRCLLFFSPRFN